MRPTDWNEIERLYEAARELDPGQREVFLRQACNGNKELRREVQSLLEREEQAAEFLEAPALELAARELTEVKALSLIGKRVGAYDVLSLLARGGMGEVYLAQDKRLDRNVALKFLPPETQQDETARQRFLREARSAAALDHPFICHLHEIGEFDGTDFIAMEYVEGGTLEQRLAKGALPFEEALQKATELAQALEAAHKRHVVHRDLKPSNIMLTSDGHVKVMDFGLAKRVRLKEDTRESEQTQSAGLSKTGMILGTLAYVSPEQLRGEPVDTRSDIFSFGVVLYEMLTGKHPFRKSEAMETGHAILSETPALLGSHLDGPRAPLQHVVRKMLVKDPARRYQHVGDVRIDLEEAISSIGDPSKAGAIDAAVGEKSKFANGRPWRKALPWALAGLASAAAVILAVLQFGHAPHELATTRFPVYLPEEIRFGRLDMAVISPDGRYIAFTGQAIGGGPLLWVHSLDSLTATVLSGTDGAYAPFWSPDSRFIGFFAGEQLKRIERAGGPVQTVCDAPGARGGAWSPKGVILFGTHRDGLFRVSEAGGEPTPVTTLDQSRGELSHCWPNFLPDGRRFLYTVEGRHREHGAVCFGSLDSRDGKQLLQDYSSAVYVPPGYLLFRRDETLMAQPFDADDSRMGESAFPVVETAEGRYTRGQGRFSASRTGVLAYYPDWGFRRRQLVWVDREGNEEPLTSAPGRYSYPSVSSDGRVAVSNNASGNNDIWIFGPNSSTRLTLDSANDVAPLWTPDGRRVVFAPNRGEEGRSNLYWKAADGTGQIERLTTRQDGQWPGSFTRDGKSLAFTEAAETTDLHLLSMEGEPKSKPLLKTRFNERVPVISPDGRWVAYESDQSGRMEVYVRPFPNLQQGWWQVSTEGGQQPLWAPNGHELFYRSPGQVNIVKIQTDPVFWAGTPTVLFRGSYLEDSGGGYAISPDGRRFVMVKEVGQTEGTVPRNEVIVVINWLNELERHMPRAE